MDTNHQGLMQSSKAMQQTHGHSLWVKVYSGTLGGVFFLQGVSGSSGVCIADPPLWLCTPPIQARNSGVRTLFLAVNGQASRFDAATWRYCMWEVLFPLAKFVHYMSDTSSSEEAAAVELGKDKGKSVMLLMHHSRNTEQKQW